MADKAAARLRPGSWEASVLCSFACELSEVRELQQAAAAVLEQERLARVSETRLRRLELIRDWDASSGQCDHAFIMRELADTLEGAISYVSWGEKCERELAAASDSDTLRRLTLRKEVATRLFGSAGFQHDRFYHWSESAWLAMPGWLKEKMQHLQDSFTAEVLFGEGGVAALAAREEKEEFIADLNRFYEDRGLQVIGAGCTWMESHPPHPGMDAACMVELEVRVQRQTLGPFMSKAKSKAISQVLGAEAFLTNALAGSRASAAVALRRARPGFTPELAGLLCSFIPTPSQVLPMLQALESAGRQRAAAAEAALAQMLSDRRSCNMRP